MLRLERRSSTPLTVFGEGTMYDNALVRGDVKIGRNSWIGPACILDSSGGELEIGDWCSISAGAQIYTHHTVNRSMSLGAEPIDCAPTKIGIGVYGPNAVIQMGVTIGDSAIIGANSFVNRDRHEYDEVAIRRALEAAWVEFIDENVGKQVDGLGGHVFCRDNGAISQADL
jgi:acetyltransferase-like isoleucine patch superfamily enzyme